MLNTNYPPNENALYWTVSAEKAGPAVVRISYLIANMAAEPSYQGVVENDEKKLLMQVYMTVTNTSGESFGECDRAARRGQDHGPLLQRRRAEADAGRQVRRRADRQALRLRRRRGPGEDADVLSPDQRQGEPDGRFPAALRQGPPVHQGAQGDGDAVRSQAFLGEDWAQYTPLFAPLGPVRGRGPGREGRTVHDGPGGRRAERPSTRLPPRAYTIDGKEGVTKPLFRNLRTRYRYRLQNFKTEKGDPITVPLTIKEHLDGEWIIEKVVLKEILGERNEQKEKEIPYADLFNVEADRRQQRGVRDEAAAHDDRQEVRSVRDDPARSTGGISGILFRLPFNGPAW